MNRITVISKVGGLKPKTLKPPCSDAAETVTVISHTETRLKLQDRKFVKRAVIQNWMLATEIHINGPRNRD